jgi:pyruvate/2-oxoglutarate dehydrogenase complex dihydrolipoamide dehydrogenase (E3) component
MTTVLRPDICVVGAGSGGLTVAAAAAAFSVPVVLIEKGKMGGDCLNYGCVPSKALLAAAKYAQAIRDAPLFGIDVDEPTIARRKVNAHIEAVIAEIGANDSEQRFTAMGVTVLRETARFVNRRTIAAGGHEIKARRFVLATGSSPLVPSIPGLAECGFFTNETIFQCPRKPEHLIVIGGGPIGIEMAQAHARLGSRVTVLEAANVLGRDDPEAVDLLVDQLGAEGIAIHEGARVSRVDRRGPAGVRVFVVTANGEMRIDGTDILLAVGRVANVAGLGLEKARIRHNERGIRVNAKLRTTNRRVYAIGDVAGKLLFTHVAAYHASKVVRTLLFRFGGRVDHAQVPWVTFAEPELAQVGMLEKDAARRHRRINVLRWPFHENDRAQAERKTAGMVKIVADQTGRILGATILGPAAGEQIHFWGLAIAKKMILRDVLNYIPPYPTYSETGRRAVISHYTPLARKTAVRLLVRLLRRLG